MARRKRVTNFGEEDRLLSRMSGWQRSQWSRAGGWIYDHIDNLRRIKKFLHLKRGSN